MFSRKYIGIALCADGIAAARLGGPARAPRLEALVHLPLPTGLLRPLLREQNVSAAGQFVDVLRDVRGRLAGSGGRVRLSLPNGVGRVMLLALEEQLGNRAETIALLRWKLKKRLAFDCNDAQLDYQPVAKRTDGGSVLLVAVTQRQVIEQYEALFAAAGFVPVAIELHVFSHANLFAQELAAQGDSCFLVCTDASLTLMVFAGGSLRFIRVRELAGSPADESRLVKEITGSVRAYHALSGESVPGRVFCVAGPQQDGIVSRMVREIFAVEPTMLQAQSIIAGFDARTVAAERLLDVTTALGAACGGM
jgi:type IV pilus assembly protein PilM